MCIKCDVLCHNELVGIQIRKKEGFYSPPNINEQRKREQKQKAKQQREKKTQTNTAWRWKSISKRFAWLIFRKN